MKYVFDLMGDAEGLYDLAADPWELENLAGRPAHSAVVDELRAKLLRWSVVTEDSQPVPVYFDQASLEPTPEPQLPDFDE